MRTAPHICSDQHVTRELPELLPEFAHRTHSAARTTIASLVHSPSRTYIQAHHFSLPIVSFLLLSYHATLWLPASVQPNSMTIDSMNDLEHIAHVRFALMLASANCVLVTALLWASAYCDERKANRNK